MADYKPTLDEIKSLRARTGVGINDVKDALVASKGNVDKAIEELRKKGVAKGAKRAGRTAAEGTIGIYAHANNSMVSLVELNAETDFVAKNEDFKQLAYDLAVHVAAMNTLYISRDTIPSEIIEAEKAAAEEELKGKPAEVKEKIIEGKLEKFYQETTLMDQPFFKDETKTVQDLMNEALAKIGEKVEVSRILTWKVGKPGCLCSIVFDDEV
jgi:elongation factor Ts